MKRVHDMGGSYEYGEIPISLDCKGNFIDDDYVFKYSWHAKALAITLASGSLGEWTLDESRHARECLLPKDYKNFSYYERWLASLVNLLVNKKIVSLKEIIRFSKIVDAENSQNYLHKSFKLDKRAWLSKNVKKDLSIGSSSSRKINIKPAFKKGDLVRTVFKNPNGIKGGHTRLPSYAMGKKGVISKYRGIHVFPDKNAHSFGEEPLPLYTVEFNFSELWPLENEKTQDIICLDLWEPYFQKQT
tara:strand:+ start:757 stop:1491 length:735 start_codon:yes stop_codon:yes gene_type:complete